MARTPMTGRDSKDAGTRIALVPEHDEIDWNLSTIATQVLELGTLGFDVDDARWVRRFRYSDGELAEWFAIGDGEAVFLAPEDRSLSNYADYLRVGELLYRRQLSFRTLGATGKVDRIALRLQIVDVCADVETVAAETDAQWERVPPGFWGDDEGTPVV